MTRIRLFAVLVLCLGIAAAVLLGMFRIHAVEIVGSQRHSVEEIKEDLIYDFWTENTLFFAWKYRNATSDSKTPYLESIQAKFVSPGKVRLMVREKSLAGYVQYAGSNVYFDKQGTVMEITEQVYEGIPMVSGITMEEPVLYQKLQVDNAARMGAMLKITDLLIQANFIPDNVSFDENLNITLTIGAITVKLGQNNCLDEKVANLVTIYQSIQGQSGTLNMESFTGKNEPITFQKSGEPESTPETDAEGNPLEGSGEEGQASREGGNGAGANGEGTPEDGQTGSGENGEDGSAGGSSDTQDDPASGETTGVSAFMVFDSSGTLRYDAHVVGGQVVDAYGTPIDGCSVDENGNVVDAYWNVIDPMTGQLAQ